MTSGIKMSLTAVNGVKLLNGVAILKTSCLHNRDHPDQIKIGVFRKHSIKPIHDIGKSLVV